MPSIPETDEFPYEAQEAGSLECVPCCVFMVTQYWELDLTWDQVVARVRFSPVDGTPFENIGYLTGVEVAEVESVGIAGSFLSQAPPVPIIANLLIRDASLCSYHRGGEALHAVVVVGMDQSDVSFFDPLTLAEEGHRNRVIRPKSTFQKAWRGGWAVYPRF
jgi:hypothetical protein